MPFPEQLAEYYSILLVLLLVCCYNPSYLRFKLFQVFSPSKYSNCKKQKANRKSYYSSQSMAYLSCELYWLWIFNDIGIVPLSHVKTMFVINSHSLASSSFYEWKAKQVKLTSPFYDIQGTAYTIGRHFSKSRDNPWISGTYVHCYCDGITWWQFASSQVLIFL